MRPFSLDRNCVRYVWCASILLLHFYYDIKKKIYSASCWTLARARAGLFNTERNANDIIIQLRDILFYSQYESNKNIKQTNAFPLVFLLFLFASFCRFFIIVFFCFILTMWSPHCFAVLCSALLSIAPIRTIIPFFLPMRIEWIANEDSHSGIWWCFFFFRNTEIHKSDMLSFIPKITL